jgi:hypothetical protein
MGGVFPILVKVAQPPRPQRQLVVPIMSTALRPRNARRVSSSMMVSWIEFESFVPRAGLDGL